MSVTVSSGFAPGSKVTVMPHQRTVSAANTRVRPDVPAGYI